MSNSIASSAVIVVLVLAFAFVDSAADPKYARLINDGNLSATSIHKGFPENDPVPNNIRESTDNQLLFAKQEDNEENCEERSIREFSEVFTYEQRRHGAVVLHLLFGFYCFILTAFICNDYLLPALDIICTQLNISTDVAGATFLATASCFPELFVNVVGTFLTQSDLGVGTVMGGAVFNTFATPACGALSAMQVSNASTPKSNEESMPDGLYRPYFHGELMVEYRKSVASRKPSVTNVETQNHVENIEEYVEPDTPFVWPTGSKLNKIWFYLVWPLKFILFITIPDTRYKRWKKWYLVTFIMCVIWIAVASYLTSWMTTVLGDTIGIPDSVMGITFQSAGGNMPELVSIIILSKQGNGDMAMSNTLGANTLDILLCLGLPWMIKILMSQKDIEIVSGALRFSVLSIVACVIAFYLVTALCKYRLNKKVGVICLILYAIFLIFALSFELNVFFLVNLPMCPP
ncbi:PREDICTED: sodium/potassium/calcium exchanger 3-like [Atta cephalotes]|uniref:Sodium/calcium exchanger membrane region domain-containing protein n=1 Tax=Atta cephalotes TaxID=12957 RepID=A0A158NTN0_ATTCE|nr:PREDICTED: sodium/potassium/calcium exchanger 3-like [Atta cephalotes]